MRDPPAPAREKDIMAKKEFKGVFRLFKNEGKQGRQPDFIGYIEMGGHKYELAGWKNSTGIAGNINDLLDDDRPKLPSHPGR